MNFKKQAQKLETFLSDEFKKELPIVVINSSTLVYRNYKIKQLKSGYWGIFKKGGFLIDKFSVRACALMAARAHDLNKLPEYFEIANLDKYYQANATDAEIFDYRMKTCKNDFDKDLATWRWEITKARADQAKQQIIQKFKQIF